MKVAGKGRITRAAFATKPRFDEMGPEGPESTSLEQTSKPSTTAESSGGRSTPRKRSSSETTQKEGNKQGKKKMKITCWGCGGVHPPFKCVLISGHNPKDTEVSSECRRTFEEKMKDSSFAEKIRIIRKANGIKRDFAAAAKTED